MVTADNTVGQTVHNYTNVLMQSCNYKAFLIHTHDISSEHKTGEFLLQLVIEDIEYCEKTFGITIIAWCADDGGDARKMRWLLRVQMPWLIIVVCWAHQIQLIVGDYLSAPRLSFGSEIKCFYYGCES